MCNALLQMMLQNVTDSCINQTCGVSDGENRAVVDNRVVVAHDNTPVLQPSNNIDAVNTPDDRGELGDYGGVRGGDNGAVRGGDYGAVRGGDGERVWVDSSEQRGQERYSALEFNYGVDYRYLDYNGNDVAKELGIGQDVDYRGNDVLALGGDDVNDGSGDDTDSSLRYRPQEPR